MVHLTGGTYTDDTVLLSPDAALALGAAPGAGISLTVPGRRIPLQLTVGGIADFSRAEPLFAARTPDNQGEFIQVPNVLAVPFSTFATILPALQADAASATPVLKPPVMEVDVRLDHSRLATDPECSSRHTCPDTPAGC
jgi:hypothetical protein